MSTAWVMVTLVVAALVLEAYSFRRSDDNWDPITHVMRRLPVWTVGLIMFVVGLLYGHFYWS